VTRNDCLQTLLWVICVVLSLTIGLPDRAVSETYFKFTAVEGMRHNMEGLRLLREAYAAIGVEFSVLYLTPNRSIQEVENGAADGELLRIQQVGHHFTEIVRVEIPVISLPIYAYTNNPQLAGLTLDEMDRYRVGYVDGALFAQRMTAKLPDVTPVESPDTLFKMLELDRLDIVIAAENPGDTVMQTVGNGRIYKGSKQLRSVEFYHYLNRRHRALVPRIEWLLTELKEGRIQITHTMER
jgi:polar amino acid transport system substrate-binding protein